MPKRTLKIFEIGNEDKPTLVMADLLCGFILKSCLFACLNTFTKERAVQAYKTVNY